jgi:hypothetical protein
VRNLGLFALAAVFEIAGCFAFWLWLRRGISPFVAALGIVSLVAFAVVLTRTDSAFAGSLWGPACEDTARFEEAATGIAIIAIGDSLRKGQQEENPVRSLPDGRLQHSQSPTGSALVVRYHDGHKRRRAQQRRVGACDGN